MAWSVLQSASLGSAGGAVTTAAKAYSSNLSAGSTLLAAVSLSGGTAVTSVKDTAGNSFVLINAPTVNAQCTALYALNTPAGDVGATTTVTATFASAEASILILEVAGLAAGTTIATLTDGSGGGINAGTGGSSASSGAYSTTALNEFLLAVYGDNGGPETWTAPAGYTGSPAGVNTNSAADIQVAWKNSTNGAETASWALTGSTANWDTVLVAFKLALVTAVAASPAVAPSVIHIQDRPRRRAIWHGSPPAVVAAAPSTPSRPAPFVARGLTPRRAVTGSNLASGDGIASQITTPLGTASRPKPFIFRSPAARRALAGSNLLCGTGIASAVVTPLGVPSRPKPFVFRSPPSRRALLGDDVQCGAGVASKATTPLGMPSLAKPFVARSPAPRRALTGNNLSCGDGNTAPAPAPVTAIPVQQPRLAPRRAPARARSGSLGLCAAGIASLIVTPRGSPSRPKPFVWRSPAPDRARLGNALSCGDGNTSAVVTPLGSPGPRLPLEARSPAPRRGLQRGFASQIVTPLGGPSSPAPRPVIQHLPGRRARVGGATAATASPVTLRAASTAGTGAAAGGAGPLSFTIPAGTAIGDLLVIWAFAGTSTALTWSATGWTAVTAVSGANGACQILYRVADGTEGSSVTVTCSVAEQWAGVIAGYYNTNPASLFDPAPSSGQVNASSTTVAAASVTTVTGGDKLLWFGAIDAGSGGTPAVLTVPSGFTAEVAQVSTSAVSGTNAGVIYGDLTQVTAGATGAENGTAASAHANAGCLISITAQYGTAYQRPPGCASGIAVTTVAPPVTVLGSPAAPRKVPSAAAKVTRARTGPAGLAGAGIAVTAASLGSPPFPAPRPVIQHRPGRRALTGNNLSCGDGIASQAVTPLGAASRPKPFIFRSPPPRRGVAGNNLQCGDGVTSAAVTPLGAASRPKPYVWRSPAPRRAQAGGNLACGGGIAVQPPFNFAGASTVTEYTCLPDTTMIGLWEMIFGSVAEGGCTQIADDASLRGVLQHKPKVSTSSGQTFSALTAGPSNGPGNFTFGIQMRTVAQLRTGSAPNNWETGWVFWDFSFPGSLTNCYYYVIKEAGTEFGRLNLGVQSILATTSSNLNPALWHTVVVTVTGNTHAVTVDGTLDITYTDTSGSALTSGQVGAYCEDSQVVFANWSLTVATPGTVRPYVFRSPAPHRALIPGGNSSTPGGGIASRIVTPLGAAGPRLPLQARRPAPSRGHWGGPAGPGTAAAPAGNPARPLPARLTAPRRVLWRGFASQAVTPLGNPGPPKPFVTRKPSVRAVTGHGGVAGGIASFTATPLGAASRPKPFVFRSPAPRRGLLGDTGLCGDGNPSAVGTPLGSASTPPPRPVIQHLPSRRARVGNNLQVGDGNASKATTPLGATAPPRLLLAWVSHPRSRAIAGHGTAAAGVASQIVTPLGSAPSPLPRPVIQHIPQRRARVGPQGRNGGGVSGSPPPPPFTALLSSVPGQAWPGLFTPGDPGPAGTLTAYQRPPVYVKRPGPARGRAGSRAGIAGGTAGRANLPLGSGPSPALRPKVFPPRNARAVTGSRSRNASGLASAIVTPLGSPSSPAPRPVIQHLPQRRSIWRGLASAISTPLGAPARPKPFVWRSPPPHRGFAGNNGQCGDGTGSQVSSPLGSPSRPKPFVFRSPAPARGRLGNTLSCSDGLTGVTTPLGGPARPKPFVFRSPAPRRALLGNNLSIGDGVTSQAVTPLGAPAPPRLLLPWVSHPHARAQAGPSGRNAAGLAGTITPRGSVGPPRPYVFRSPAPHRALLGNNLLCGDGLASAASTPMGTPPVSLVRPVIVHLPSVRAHTGPLGRNGGGNPAAAIAALGAASQRAPQMAPRAIPARARTGPQGRNAGGLAAAPVTQATACQHAPSPAGRAGPGRARLGPLGRNTGGLAAPQAATAAVARRPSVFRSPPPRRAQVGNNLTCGDGLTGPAGTVMGFIPPKRIRQPWVSYPRSRAVTTAHPAAGAAFFSEGPGTVSAADSITRTVLAADRHVMSVSAADRLVMGVKATDSEP